MYIPNFHKHTTPYANVTGLKLADVQNAATFSSQKHPFHILGPSEFPFLTGLFLFTWLVPQVFYMHGLAFPLCGSMRTPLIHLGFSGLFGVVMVWFFTILHESCVGFHTKKVQQGLRFGVLLFIASEVMFFFAFFWGFFHYSLVPSAETGNVWPPFGTQELDAWGLPLVNTLLLLTSGVTVTAAHAAVIKNQQHYFMLHLGLTVLLGVVFLLCQAYEYKYGVKFSWRDNVYGSIFFITTGFHGLHVTIGTAFLAFCLTRWVQTWCILVRGRSSRLRPLMRKGYPRRWAGFVPDHHFGFEAAAWYWHFVDVVWLFLFLAVYWWGGK